MSALSINLKVVINLLAGVSVFKLQEKETLWVAEILDSQSGWVSENRSDTKSVRAFRALERMNKKFILLRGELFVLKRRVKNLYKMSEEEISFLENWLNGLIQEKGYKETYSIECPWYVFVGPPTPVLVAESVPVESVV